MEKKLIIYDPPMCCSSGVCGPNPDQGMIDIQGTITRLRKSGVVVERYIINQSPEKFKENPEVIELIQKHQLNILPITTYDGKVVKMGAYPTLEEFKVWYPDELPDKLDSLVTVPVDEGCCADQDSCDISCGPQYQQAGGNCC